VNRGTQTFRDILFNLRCVEYVGKTTKNSLIKTCNWNVHCNRYQDAVSFTFLLLTYPICHILPILNFFLTAPVSSSLSSQSKLILSLLHFSFHFTVTFFTNIMESWHRWFIQLFIDNGKWMLTLFGSKVWGWKWSQHLQGKFLEQPCQGRESSWPHCQIALSAIWAWVNGRIIFQQLNEVTGVFSLGQFRLFFCSKLRTFRFLSPSVLTFSACFLKGICFVCKRCGTQINVLVCCLGPLYKIPLFWPGN